MAAIFSKPQGEPCSLPKSFKDLTLHLQVGCNIAARGGHRCMTEIITNHRNIHTSLQKCNRATMPHHMWRHMALSKRRSVFCGEPDVLGQ